MLLTIDVGNTNIAFGLIDGSRIIGRFRLMTKTPRTSDEFRTFIDEFLSTCRVRPEEVEDSVLSSVVPKINHALASGVVKVFGRRPIVIDYQTPVNIRIAIDNPREIGADLIVDMAAAYERYHDSCLVLDFGTATTCTYLDKEGACRYALICPGLEIMANVLTDNAAKLPEIEIRKPESILASNTVDAMQAGVIYGYIGLVEKIITDMKHALHDPDCRVLATGGLGKMLSEAIPMIDEYDKDLAYKGMQIIYRKSKEEKR